MQENVCCVCGSEWHARSETVACCMNIRSCLLETAGHHHHTDTHCHLMIEMMWFLTQARTLSSYQWNRQTSQWCDGTQDEVVVHYLVVLYFRSLLSECQTKVLPLLHCPFSCTTNTTLYQFISIFFLFFLCKRSTDQEQQKHKKWLLQCLSLKIGKKQPSKIASSYERVIWWWWWWPAYPRCLLTSRRQASFLTDTTNTLFTALYSREGHSSRASHLAADLRLLCLSGTSFTLFLLNSMYFCCCLS